tara:strand:- start:1318 stop:1536 length:219 start_codon:yes stop_codon:yes gene_type:complete
MVLEGVALGTGLGVLMALAAWFISKYCICPFGTILERAGIEVTGSTLNGLGGVDIYFLAGLLLLVVSNIVKG